MMVFHMRKIHPPVRGRMAHYIDFARSISVFQFHAQQIRFNMRLRIQHRQG